MRGSCRGLPRIIVAARGGSYRSRLACRVHPSNAEASVSEIATRYRELRAAAGLGHWAAVKQLARSLGVDRPTVLRILERAGLHNRPPGQRQ
jgi:hypothetical protein